MFKGLKAPGPAFIFDPLTATYQVLRGVHTADLAPASTESLLEKFAVLATQLRRVQAFSDAAVFTSAAESSPMSEEIEFLRALPTIAAFGAAVSQQVLAIRGQLVEFEELLAKNSNRLKLLSLRLKLAIVSRQVTAVHHVVKACRWKGDPACTAASVLDVLHNSLEIQLMQSGSHGGVIAGMLGEIFAAAWEPLASAIDDWLLRGSLESAPPEFFIFKIDENSDQGAFWSDKYMLRRQEDGTVAAPALLKAIVEQLLSAGLAAVGLQHAEQTQRVALPSNAFLPRGAFDEETFAQNAYRTDGTKLYVEFCQRMRSLLLQWAPSSNLSSGTPLDHLPPITKSSQPRLSLAAQLVSSQATTSLQNDDREPEGSCIEEWTAAVARSPGTAVVPANEDLCDLPLLPPTPFHLPAAALCPAGTALDAGDTNDDEENNTNSQHAQHPVARAMHQATVARARQAAAGRAEVLAAAFTTQFNASANDRTFQVQSSSSQDSPKEVAPMLMTHASCTASPRNNNTLGADGDLGFGFGGEREWGHMFTRVARALFSTSQSSTVQTQTNTLSNAINLGSITPLEGPEGGLELGLQTPKAILQNFTPDSPTAVNTYNTAHSRPLFAPLTAATTSTSVSTLPTDASCWASSLPLQVLGSRCFIEPLKTRIHRTGTRTCETMLNSGIIPQLTMLRHIAAAGGPYMEPFVQYLLTHISTSRGVDGLSSFELNMALENALVGAREEAGPVVLPAVRAAVRPASSAGGKKPEAFPGQLATTVGSLHRLMITLEAPFPLSLIADESFLKLHTSVCIFSLQLQWVEQTLVAARVASWKKKGAAATSLSLVASASAPATRSTQQQMLHLVRAVRMHMLTALEVAGKTLETSMVKCSSLSEVVSRCKEFESAVHMGCLLDTSEHDVRAVLLEALESSLRHCILLGHARRVEADLIGVGAQILAADAQVRLGRIQSVIHATEKQFAEHRGKLLSIIAAQQHQSGAQGDAAKALLATLDVDAQVR